MPFDSTLNFALWNVTFFKKKSGRGTEKSSKTWKTTLEFFCNVLCDQWPENFKAVGTNLLQIQQTANNGSMIGYVTPLIFFAFLDFGHLQGVTRAGGGSKLDQKCKLWVSRFRKNWKFSNIIETLFVYAKLLSLVKISAKLDCIWGSNYPKRAILCTLNQYAKLWKFLTWQTSNVILMKLTRIIFIRPLTW